MMGKLNAKAFGLAFGILWAGGAVFMGLLAMVCNWAQPFVDVLSVMYVGYNATIVGCLIGAAWAFIDAFIGGYLLAWLYNNISRV
jgi:hypothetical protein